MRVFYIKSSVIVEVILKSEGHIKSLGLAGNYLYKYIILSQNISDVIPRKNTRNIIRQLKNNIMEFHKLPIYYGRKVNVIYPNNIN